MFVHRWSIRGQRLGSDDEGARRRARAAQGVEGTEAANVVPVGGAPPGGPGRFAGPGCPRARPAKRKNSAHRRIPEQRNSQEIERLERPADGATSDPLNEAAGDEAVREIKLKRSRSPFREVGAMLVDVGWEHSGSWGRQRAFGLPEHRGTGYRDHSEHGRLQFHRPGPPCRRD